ncbi:MAG: tRNA (adenosine(37)-N6)-threonylcarbamoyltransferase complex dimerization subunit type 1 TsaB [Chloroflexi bacterium]|nr:tRNA (adenosine(37)-N6)-threonylcarbamoyltransferase complex dimerization subunit type 1 TsaB [Chloroflexota bacterium]
MTMVSDPRRPWILAIDTGTSEIVVAAGGLDGSVIAASREPADFRHGELLLATIERLMEETGLGRGSLRAIVVGTGPGAFTGLRVGLATAKTLAHAFEVPLFGVGTAAALIRAAARSAEGPSVAERDVVLLLPAGPRERVIVRDGMAPRILAEEGELATIDSSRLVAVDLDTRAPDPAIARGAAARGMLAATLMEIGAARLRSGQADDPALLVPDYVTLPRGIRASTGAIEWSNDPR